MFECVTLLPLEAAHAGNIRQAGPAEQPCRQDQLLRVERHGPAAAGDLELPFLARIVIGGRTALRPVPDIDVHYLGIGIEPIGELVLRRIDRPGLGIGKIRHGVEPARRVQRQALMAFAPRVGVALAALDHQGRHVEPGQPRGKRKAGMAGADDHAVGLAGLPEFPRLVIAPTTPVLASLAIGEGRAVRTSRTDGFDTALELGHRRQQGPAFAILEPDDGAAARDGGLELGHALDRVAGEPRRADRSPGCGQGPCDAVGKQLADRLLSLRGMDIPGKGHEIAPKPIGQEEIGRRIDIAPRHRGVECDEPCAEFLVRCTSEHSAGPFGLTIRGTLGAGGYLLISAEPPERLFALQLEANAARPGPLNTLPG